jgi:hypothetical protein
MGCISVELSLLDLHLILFDYFDFLHRKDIVVSSKKKYLTNFACVPESGPGSSLNSFLKRRIII